MEESQFIASLQILYKSQNITHLDAELFDFQDNLLSTLPLFNGISSSLPIQKPLRSFYFRLINSDLQISDLFSYFWSEDEGKEGSVNLSESFENFIIEISINIQQNKNVPLPNKQPEAQIQIDPKEHLRKLKQKVFEALQAQNFFIQENSRVKCNFIRKNKTHKNLTALLIKNSTNILKKINQNMNYTAAKTYNQLKTSQTNETADQITLQVFPPDKMKKTNSVQDCSDWHETDLNCLTYIKKEEAPCQEKICEARANKSGLKKRGFFVRGKKEYVKKLQKQTATDLKNQRQTLTIIRSYVADKVIKQDSSVKKVKYIKTNLRRCVPVD